MNRDVSLKRPAGGLPREVLGSVRTADRGHRPARANSTSTRWRLPLMIAVAGWCMCAVGATLHAQNSSLFAEELPPVQPQPDSPGPFQRRPPLTLRDGSWTYVPVPPPRQVRMYDRVTVRVDELASTQSEGEMERRKDALYDAILQDWVELIGLKAIKPSPQRDGDQRIRGQLQQLFRAEGEMETREALALNMACTVADIRPNGDLVLEGHKQIQINDESWEVSLTGICRHVDVGPDNVVLSRNIVNLKIIKRERGHVRDSYKRGWFLRWFDEFHPF